METELRSEVREQIALPLSAEDGVGGATRDISASGLFFELNSDAPLGSEVDFTVELTLADRSYALKGHGEIIRVEQHAGRTGLAVRITRSTLQVSD